MKMHEEWCIKSKDGLHCFHFLKPEKEDLEPTKEKCCWCGKVRNIHKITGSYMIQHGKEVKEDEEFFYVTNMSKLRFRDYLEKL